MCNVWRLCELVVGANEGGFRVEQPDHQGGYTMKATFGSVSHKGVFGNLLTSTRFDRLNRLYHS